MSARDIPDAAADDTAPALNEWPSIPGITEAGREPHFFAPWQAKAFALTIALVDKSVIDWPDWVAAFSARLHADIALPDAASSMAHAEQYFTAWLATLEGFVGNCGIPPDALSDAAKTWQRAAHATPHGQPILFASGVEQDV